MSDPGIGCDHGLDQKVLRNNQTASVGVNAGQRAAEVAAYLQDLSPTVVVRVCAKYGYTRSRAGYSIPTPSATSIQPTLACAGS